MLYIVFKGENNKMYLSKYGLGYEFFNSDKDEALIFDTEYTDVEKMRKKDWEIEFLAYEELKELLEDEIILKKFIKEELIRRGKTNGRN